MVKGYLVWVIFGLTQRLILNEPYFKMQLYERFYLYSTAQPI